MKNQDSIFRYIKDYLTFEDEDYLIPPTIFYAVFMAGLVTSLVFSCESNHKDEVKHIDMTIEVDTTQYPAEQVVLETDIDSTKLVISKSKYWSSKETGLPVGIVYMMDYAGSAEDEGAGNQSDNYVTIKSPDGRLKVISDIDVDLYLSLQKGDTIK